MHERLGALKTLVIDEVGVFLDVLLTHLTSFLFSLGMHVHVGFTALLKPISKTIPVSGSGPFCASEPLSVR